MQKKKHNETAMVTCMYDLYNTIALTHGCFNRVHINMTHPGLKCRRMTMKLDRFGLKKKKKNTRMEVKRHHALDL